MSGAPWNSLKGVKVLEVSQYISGPYGATLLGMFGADVIKVEALDGDPSRQTEPLMKDDYSVSFAAFNHQKRYISVDLKNPESKAVMERLVAQSDVLIQNIRPGGVEKFGLHAKACHKINPRLIHISLRAFYPKLGNLPGMDVLLQAESGLMAMTGDPDRPPSRISVSLLDYTGSMWAAMGAMAALRDERKNVAIRISLMDVAMFIMGSRACMYLATGVESKRMGHKLPHTTPHGVYPTADGDIVVSGTTDRMFASLAPLLGPEIAGDERFKQNAGRVKHRDELDAKMEAVLRTQTSEVWKARMQEAGVQVAVVRGMGEGVDRHKELSPTGFRRFSETGLVAPPLEVEGSSWELTKPPGELGQHTREVLTEAGFSQPEIDALEARGVIRTNAGSKAPHN